MAQTTNITMDFELTIKVLEIVVAILSIIVPGVIGAVFWVTSRITRIETNMEWLMGSIDSMGKNAAKVLHRDDDKFKIDDLLERYYNRSFELSYEEWLILSAKCDLIIEDTNLDRGYRSAAVFLKMVCDHKLRHDPKKYKL